jgi:hypothetical protein
MLAETIICVNKRKSAACRAFMAIPLLTRNFFRTDIIKIRGDIACMYIKTPNKYTVTLSKTKFDHKTSYQ